MHHNWKMPLKPPTMGIDGKTALHAHHGHGPSKQTALGRVIPAVGLPVQYT